MLREHHTTTEIQGILRADEPLFGIGQLLDARPILPLFHRFVDKGDFSLDGGIMRHCEKIIFHQCQLTSHIQVAIFCNQGIQFSEIIRPGNLGKCISHFVPHHVGSHQASRLRVTLFVIMPIKQFVVFRLKTENTQQIVVKILAVVALNDQRHIALRFHTRQQFGFCQRLLEISLAYLSGVLADGIIGIHVTQHRLANSSQHRVLRLRFLLGLHQSFDLNLKRIRRDGRHRLHPTQSRFHELAVCLLAASLLHQLVEHLKLSLGQVVCQRLFILAP